MTQNLYKLSRGEICLANFIPPANGVSVGSYLVKNGLFCQKGQTKTALPHKSANFLYTRFWALLNFSPFYFASPEIIEVEICYIQTNSLTPYAGVCRFFLQVKFATSLLALLAGEKSLLDPGFDQTNDIEFSILIGQHSAALETM